MTKSDVPPPRPVSLVTIVAIYVVFAAFFLFLHWTYAPVAPAEPYNLVPQNLPKDQLDTATPEARIAYLQDLRARHAKQLATYAWADPQKKDIVHIPIERAMQLVIQENSK